MANKQTLHFCYAADDNYLVPLAVALLSLLENHPQDQLTVWILADKLAEKNKNKLRKLCSPYHCQLNFCPIEKKLKQLAHLGVRKWLNGSLATYARIFISQLLPIEVKRLVYLDCDTIVNTNLAALYHYPLKGKKALGAVVEAAHQQIKISRHLKASDNYYNAGVLLIDLEKFRHYQLEKIILEHVKEVRADYLYVDQDLINICCQPYLERLPIKYNLTHPFLLWSRSQLQHLYQYDDRFYSQDELSRAQKHPGIIHFAGEFFGRPWNKNNFHPYAYLFDGYLEKTVWKNYQKQNAILPPIVHCQRFLYRSLPKKIFLYLSQWATWYNSKSYR